MLYLLDANVLITAHNRYYPIDRVPEFWEWLSHVGSGGHVKVPIEVYEEIMDGNDVLADWARDERNQNALLLQEVVDTALLLRVVAGGYAPDLTDVEIEKIGRDPFLISYALAASDQRCVVTTEASKQAGLGRTDTSLTCVRPWVCSASTLSSSCVLSTSGRLGEVDREPLRQRSRLVAGAGW